MRSLLLLSVVIAAAACSDSQQTTAPADRLLPDNGSAASQIKLSGQGIKVPQVTGIKVPDATAVNPRGLTK